MPLETGLSVLVLTSMALAAYGVGRTVLGGVGVGAEDRLDALVWSIGAGLALVGTGLAVLGLCGLLYAPLIGVLTIGGAFWGLGQVLAQSARRDDADAPDLDHPGSETDPLPSAPDSPPGWIRWGVLLLAVVACVGSLLGALAPPTAGDALCYHLELPQRFLQAHALTYSPYDDNCTFPLLAEMLYLWALALDGAVAAQAVHWGMGLLLGLATVCLARPVVGRPWAWIAGGVVLLVPGVNNQMTAPLNDVALALWTTLAAAAWHRATVTQEGRRWLVLAGVAAGAALATKYTAAIFAAAMVLCWLGSLARRPRERRLLLQGAAVVGVVAASIAGLWYVRAAWHRGNPVYPFAAELFAGGEVPPPRAETFPKAKSPLGRGPLGLAAAPWAVTMHPERFGGRGHQVGALFLAALPGLALARRLRGLAPLLALAGAYGLLWFLLRQNVRFLLPAVPLAAVGVAWVVMEMRRMPGAPRAVAAAGLAAIVTASSLAAAVRCRDCLAVALGLERRSDFLSFHEPSYPAAAVANLLLGEDARILSQEYRGFYFKHPLVRESIYRRVTGYDRAVKQPGDLARVLAKEGFTHLLLVENLAGQGIAYDDTLGRLADAEMAASPDGPLQELTQYRFCDSDGAMRRYRLLRLR